LFAEKKQPENTPSGPGGQRAKNGANGGCKSAQKNKISLLRTVLVDAEKMRYNKGT